MLWQDLQDALIVVARDGIQWELVGVFVGGVAVGVLTIVNRMTRAALHLDD